MTSDLRFAAGDDRDWPLVVVRRRGAKGMRLSVDPRDATVRLSLPLRAPLSPALRWAAGKRGWVEQQLAKLPSPQPIVPGMHFLLGGDAVVLDWNAAYPRRPHRIAHRLLVGGPREQMPARVLRFLKRTALETLDRETRALAAANGITIARVGIGDPKSRWGSCAATGDIRYSWRLILAPDDVRRATVAHEVAHRVHMNHGPDFHALVAALHDADPQLSHRWLRTNGAALHWFGRG